MNKNKELFEEAPIPKAVAVMAIPTMISMLVVVIYNMADTFFIGQTNDAMQVAAVSLATPVFMIFMALGNLFGIGGSSAISRALGEKKFERAKHISSFCCLWRARARRCCGGRIFDWNGQDPAYDRSQ